MSKMPLWSLKKFERGEQLVAGHLRRIRDRKSVLETLFSESLIEEANVPSDRLSPAPLVRRRSLVGDVGRNRVSWEEVNLDVGVRPEHGVHTSAVVVERDTVAVGRARWASHTAPGVTLRRKVNDRQQRVPEVGRERNAHLSRERRSYWIPPARPFHRRARGWSIPSRCGHSGDSA